MVGFVAASNLERDEDPAQWSRCYFGTASTSPTGQDLLWQPQMSRGLGWVSTTSTPLQRISQAATTALTLEKNPGGISPNPKRPVASHGPLTFTVETGSNATSGHRGGFSLKSS